MSPSEVLKHSMEPKETALQFKVEGPIKKKRLKFLDVKTLTISLWKPIKLTAWAVGVCWPGGQVSLPSPQISTSWWIRLWAASSQQEEFKKKPQWAETSFIYRAPESRSLTQHATLPKTTYRVSLGWGNWNCLLIAFPIQRPVCKSLSLGMRRPPG